MLDATSKSRIQHEIDRLVSDLSLKEFLAKLVLSDNDNQNLLCLCILIELNYSLVEQNHYVTIINDIASRGTIVDFDSFTGTFISDIDKIIFACDYSFHSCCDRQPVSRTVDLNGFNLYIAGYDHNPGRLRFREELDISESLIRANGWSSGNGVVWVTPSSKINQILDIAEHDTHQANKICDHVGWARSIDFLRKTGGHFVLINYSEDFPDEFYQPNCTNAGLHNPEALFISYNNDDGFGRTYNENSIEYAKEQVHKTSISFDKKFKGIYIGKMSVDLGFTRSGILQEAMTRLGL